MVEQAYETEDVLQQLLADYPELLAGDQGDREPRRWLLLGREAPLGDAVRDSRWSVDHLFVDQDGVPTIVEVKRSTDGRIRREVVGQMLEYAANAVAYWRLDDLRSRFEIASAKRDGGADGLLAELLGPDTDPEGFWELLRTNLSAGRLRLVFVSDEIPPELRRIVEFLNEQMQEAEVLAVEVKQYIDADGEHQTIVPRLLGQTEKARQAKGQALSWRWDRESLLSALLERQGPKAVHVAERVLAWAEERQLRSWFGRGHQEGSLTPGLDVAPRCYPFVLYTYGKIEVQFKPLARRPPFDRLDMRAKLLERLNAIDDVALPQDGLGRRPSFPLSALEDDPSLDAFLTAMDWVLHEVQAAARDSATA